MKAQLYTISSTFAKRSNIPCIFAAVVVRETERAVYLYGHGSLESLKTGNCCQCGRTLTHPVSVILGIGPECGKHYWDYDKVGGYSEDNLKALQERLAITIKNKLVDQWFPKAVIKSTQPSEESIGPPQAVQSPIPKKEVLRQAVMVKYDGSDLYAIKITFPFNRDDLQNVKTLEGRKYNGEHKFWTCPLTYDSVQFLNEWGFKMDPKLLEYSKEARVDVTQLIEVEDITGLQMELFPYQSKGVAFVDAKKGRALIADSMGLGKTAQALAWLQKHPEVRPALIIVPASLKLNWKREAHMWMDNPNTQVISGKLKVPLVGEIIIINYDLLPNKTKKVLVMEKGFEVEKVIELKGTGWVDRLKDHNFKCAIFDEIHMLKSNKARRTKAAKKIIKSIPCVLGLSGTPIVNRPVEFYNIINMIDPTLFPDYWKYAKRYCGAKHNGFGWDFNGSSNTKELHDILTSSIMLRRKKSEVLKELPDKIHSFTPLSLDNIEEYHAAERDFIVWLKATRGKEAAEKASGAETLTKMEVLKQLAVKGKMKQAIDWIENFLENGEKLIVMATHKFVIDELMNTFKGAVKVDGSVSGPNRQLAVDKFQNDDATRLFVGNIKAAGVGLTLTAASTVAFLELPWTPGDLTQAADRAHRIGQKNTVNIQYLLAQNTIEEEIAELLDEKRKVLDAVLDGEDSNESTLLVALMNKYTDK